MSTFAGKDKSFANGVNQRPRIASRSLTARRIGSQLDGAFARDHRMNAQKNLDRFHHLNSAEVNAGHCRVDPDQSRTIVRPKCVITTSTQWSQPGNL